MAEVFEAIMVICFGISWPFSVYKSIKSKSTKGKSVIFLSAIIIGYICGIVGKLVGHFVDGADIRYPFYFYIFNLLIVSTDFVIYFINRNREKKAKIKE